MIGQDRIPPHNIDAEMALLGALLVDRELVPLIAPIAKAEDFYAHVHVLIFEALLSLYDRGERLDKITLSEDLRRRDLLEKVGGISYLSQLMDTVETAASATYYAKIVAEKAQLRRQIHAGIEIARIAYDGESDVDGAAAQAEDLLRGAFSASERMDLGSTLEQQMPELFRELDDACQHRSEIGISSPWRALDDQIGRMHAGEVVVVGGAPGSGKSLAVGQLAEHVAEHHGDVALFALEMGSNDVRRRMLAKRAGVSTRRLRSGAIGPRDWERISVGMSDLAKLPIRIFDRFPRKGTRELRRGLQHMATTRPPKLVIVDHANFLSDAVVSDGRSSKHDRLDRMYQELLSIASEFSVVMLLVQHLNRQGMEGVPSLAHLRDGGNLEGHAHMVIFTHRPDPIHNPTSAQFIVAKNRDGKIGVIEMTFDAEHLVWRCADDVQVEMAVFE